MGRRPKPIASSPTPTTDPAPATVRRTRARGQRAAPEGEEVGATESSLFAASGQEVARLVLETVAQMPYPGVGLRTIAGILRGETRANWLSYIARTENWGALFPNPLASVEAFLRDLVRAGYIEGKHFVRLTDRGQRVLEGSEDPPVPRRPLKAVPRELRPLLWKLLLLRARLVNERKAPGLLKDAVLLALLEKRPTKVSALKGIKGIGAFIARQLGKEIIRIVREFEQSRERPTPAEPAGEAEPAS